MAPRVQMTTDDGIKEYPAYNDNRELAKDFRDGSIWAGMEIIYKSMICEILCDFIDEDGVCFLELIFMNGLMGNIQFTVCR